MHHQTYSNHSYSWLIPAGVGAGLMFLLDPDRGARRRALIRDKAVSLAHQTADASDALMRDLGNRTHGLVAELRSRMDAAPVDDSTLAARVRAQLGRLTTHPGAIEVTAANGRVTLSGPVLAQEHSRLTRGVGRIAGVSEVIDQLQPHLHQDSVPALQGEGRLPASWSTRNWSPAARFLAILGGIGMVAYGLRSGTVGGGVTAMAGAGLMARGLTDADLSHAVESARGALQPLASRASSFVTRSRAGQAQPTDWSQVAQPRAFV